MIAFRSIFSSESGFIIYHLVLIVVFALLRLPLMQRDVISSHYDGTRENRFVNPFFDAFFNSVMAQTALGITDLVPTSLEAKTIYLIQGALSFAIISGFVVYR